MAANHNAFLGYLMFGDLQDMIYRKRRLLDIPPALGNVDPV